MRGSADCIQRKAAGQVPLDVAFQERPEPPQLNPLPLRPRCRRAFVTAMNEKAVELGMHSTRCVDSTGLSSDNVSTAEDLAKLVTAAYRSPVIQQYTTLTGYTVHSSNGRMLAYNNSNGLV